MAKESLRLGGLIWYDTDKDKDLEYLIKQLSSTHKFGEFVGYLLRMAVENPSLIESEDGVWKYGTVTDKLHKLGYTEKKKSQIDELREKTIQLKRVTDKIYEMCHDMYVLTQVGEVLNLEKKVENTLKAEFTLERYIKSVTDEIGLAGLSSSLSEASLKEEKERALKTADYIVNTYDKLFNVKDESDNKITKDDFNKLIEAVNKLAESGVSIKSIDNENETSITDNKQVEQSEISEEPKESNESKESKESNNEQYIDFGETADLDALQLLLG